MLALPTYSMIRQMLCSIKEMFYFSRGRKQLWFGEFSSNYLIEIQQKVRSSLKFFLEICYKIGSVTTLFLFYFNILYQYYFCLSKFCILLFFMFVNFMKSLNILMTFRKIITSKRLRSRSRWSWNYFGTWSQSRK